jgi:hypothetical protein
MKSQENSKSILKLIEEISCSLDERKINFPLENTSKEFHIPEEAEELGARLRVSAFEAFLFSLVFDLGIDDDHVSTRDISRKCQIPLSEYGRMIRALNALFELGYLFRDSGWKSRMNYSVVPEVYKSILEEDKIPDIDSALLFTDKYDLASKMEEYLDSLDDRKIDIERAYQYISRLLQFNRELPFAKVVDKYSLDREETLLMARAYLTAVEGENEIYVGRMLSSIFKSARDRMKTKRYLNSEGCKLIKEGLLRFKEDEFVSRDVLELTPQGVEALFEDDAKTIVQTHISEEKKGLVSPESIPVRNLFYNPPEEEQVKLLTDLLTADNYSRLCERLRDKGMNDGATILFHGGPGTGKTQTVYQIARQTGRSILSIDVSTVKDKFVGESEKNCREIFARYRKICEGVDKSKTGILFLNEADSLFFKRMKVRNSVDQSFNSMVNVILEELEKFSGILFATSNLITNMDPAMDRRILFKVGFHQPNQEVRERIIADKFPFLPTDTTREIASYKLSGGNLDNILKKSITHELLQGHYPTLETIKKWCREESVLSVGGNARSPVGFLVDQKSN